MSCNDGRMCIIYLKFTKFTELDFYPIYTFHKVEHFYGISYLDDLLTNLTSKMEVISKNNRHVSMTRQGN